MRGSLSTVEHMKEFLSNRCQILEAVHHRKENNNKSQVNSISKQRSDHIVSHVSTQDKGNQISCSMCQEDHKIYQCQKLRDLQVQARINEIKRLKLCLNCLGKRHTVKNCKAGNCKQCNKKHNSLLHLEDRSDDAQQRANVSRLNHKENSVNANEVTSSTNEKQSIQSISTCSLKQPAQVLLSTAIVYIENNAGQKIEARALLDNGSQSNFISRTLCDKLNLPKRKIQLSIGAIAQAVTHISAATSATISSRFLRLFNETIILRTRRNHG